MTSVFNLRSTAFSISRELSCDQRQLSISLLPLQLSTTQHHEVLVHLPCPCKFACCGGLFSRCARVYEEMSCFAEREFYKSKGVYIDCVHDETHYWLFCCLANVVTEANKAVKPTAELKKATASTFAAIAIGCSILGNPLVADAMDVQPMFSSTNVVAEKVVRQGLYNEYEVEISQEKDDARSTFKSASEFGRESRCFGTVCRSWNVRLTLPFGVLSLPFQARQSLRKVSNFRDDREIMTKECMQCLTRGLFVLLQGSTRRSLPFLLSDLSSSQWPNTFGTWKTMTLLTSSLPPRTFPNLNLQRRRVGLTKGMCFPAIGRASQGSKWILATPQKPNNRQPPSRIGPGKPESRWRSSSRMILS